MGTAVISTFGIAVAMAISHHLFHFLMSSKQVSFSTTHGLCGNCFEQIKRRRMFASLVKQLCLASIVISAVIFTSVIVFTLLFLLPQPTEGSIIYAALGFCGGLLFLAGGLLGADRIVRWGLPKSLKPISKPPFQLVGFHKL
jgi:predicted Abi (CAAX) family protease